MMNVCNFTGLELDQSDKGIKKILRGNNLHGNQCRFYLRRTIPQKETLWKRNKKYRKYKKDR